MCNQPPPGGWLGNTPLHRKLKLFLFVGERREEEEKIASLSLLSHWQVDSEKSFSLNRFSLIARHADPQAKTLFPSSLSLHSPFASLWPRCRSARHCWEGQSRFDVHSDGTAASTLAAHAGAWLTDGIGLIRMFGKLEGGSQSDYGRANVYACQSHGFRSDLHTVSNFTADKEQNRFFSSNNYLCWSVILLYV